MLTMITEQVNMQIFAQRQDTDEADAEDYPPLESILNGS